MPVIVNEVMLYKEKKCENGFTLNKWGENGCLHSALRYFYLL